VTRVSNRCDCVTDTTHLASSHLCDIVLHSNCLSAVTVDTDNSNSIFRFWFVHEPKANSSSAQACFKPTILWSCQTGNWTVTYQFHWESFGTFIVSYQFCLACRGG